MCAQGGMQRVRSNLQSRVKKGAMSQDAFDKAMSLLKGDLTYESFKVSALARAACLSTCDVFGFIVGSCGICTMRCVVVFLCKQALVLDLHS